MACPLDVRPHQWQPSSSMMISPCSLRNTGFHRFWLTSWLTFSRQPRRQPPVGQAGTKRKRLDNRQIVKPFHQSGWLEGKTAFFGSLFILYGYDAIQLQTHAAVPLHLFILLLLSDQHFQRAYMKSLWTSWSKTISFEKSGTSRFFHSLDRKVATWCRHPFD